MLLTVDYQWGKSKRKREKKKNSHKVIEIVLHLKMLPLTMESLAKSKIFSRLNLTERLLLHKGQVYSMKKLFLAK